MHCSSIDMVALASMPTLGFPISMTTRRFQLVLLGLYLATFFVCAIRPYDRGVWIAENTPIILLVATVVWASKFHCFSKTACLFMVVLPILHTVGGHFTFERVPFDWVTDAFGFERNHYDRIAHFSVGFYAYALAELFAERQWIKPKPLILVIPILIILAVAGAYEIFEWLYAISSDPEAGAAVLGSQGDVWDAQKDMLADTVGAVLSVSVYWAQTRSRQMTPRSLSDSRAN